MRVLLSGAYGLPGVRPEAVFDVLLLLSFLMNVPALPDLGEGGTSISSTPHAYARNCMGTAFCFFLPSFAVTRSTASFIDDGNPAVKMRRTGDSRATVREEGRG